MTKQQRFIVREVKPFYKVIDNNTGVTKHYQKVKEIADEYQTSPMNIFHLQEGKKSRTLNLEVVKEPYPYLYTYQGVDYEAKNFKEIAETVDLAISGVYNIVYKWMKEHGMK